jgi:hypothetical protein
LGKSLQRAALMSAGKANDIEFTVKDLIGVATSFDALGLTGRVPIKFGHNDTQSLTDGQPALGWVSRIYVEGDTLYGDFTDMPTSVYELIRSGAYKFLSVELLRDVQAGTRKLPWVLDAVALLGADQPAFGTLADLQSLTMKRKPALQARARVEMRRGFSLSSEARKGMSDENFDEKLQAALKKQREEMRAEFKADLDKVTATAKAEADAQVAKAKAEAHRAQIKAKFETAVKAEALLPAKRESFYKFNRVDDDTSVVQIKLEDVDAYIEEFSDKAKLAAANKQQTQGGGGTVVHAATNAEEVSRLTDISTVARGFKANDFAAQRESTRIVLSSNPKLAKAYTADPNGEYKPEAA